MDMDKGLERKRDTKFLTVIQYLPTNPIRGLLPMEETPLRGRRMRRTFRPGRRRTAAGITQLQNPDSVRRTNVVKNANKENDCKLQYCMKTGNNSRSDLRLLLPMRYCFRIGNSYHAIRKFVSRLQSRCFQTSRRSLPEDRRSVSRCEEKNVWPLESRRCDVGGWARV